MRTHPVVHTHTVVSVAMGLAVLASGACSVDLSGSGALLQEERSFDVDVNGDDLRLSLRTFDGSVDVRSWDRDEVRLTITRRAADTTRAESFAVDVTREGNAIAVSAPRPSTSGPLVRIGPGMGDSVSFRVDVPRELALEVRTNDGRIQIDGVSGAIDLETDDGSVRGDQLGGDVDVRTSDGSIQLSGLDGRVSARTSDGSVRLDGRFDALSVDTSDGSVQIAARDGSTMQDDWSIGTLDGSIRLVLPAAFDADLEARTGDGSIRLDGERATGGDGGSMQTRLGEGGRRLRLQSGDGSINVRRQ